MDQTTQRPVEWSTLEQYEGDPAHTSRVTPAEWDGKPEGFARALSELEMPELNMRRRDFLRLSGFAAVLAMASGCMKPEEKILPYVKAPEEIIPGVPNYYASTCGGCEAGCGIIVKTREARPIKLEGNPDHPVNQGKLCSRGQSSIIGLYDPDRLREPRDVRTGNAITVANADRRVADALAKSGGRAALLTGTIHGPARRALLDRFKAQFPGLRHVTCDAYSDEDRAAAFEETLGWGAVPRYRFDKAEVAVTLASDPMADSHSVVETMGGIADQRRLLGKTGDYTMGRLIAFEPLMTQTGMNADERFKIRSEEALDVALALLSHVAAKARAAGVAVDVDGFDAPGTEGRLGLPAGTIERLADELWAARGKALVYTGGPLANTAHRRQLHHAVNLLNYLLDAFDNTIDFSRASNQSGGSASDLLNLVADMEAGRIDVLLVEGTNPAYWLPAAAGFADAMANVALKVSYNQHLDETTRLCDLAMGGLHFLESWGDAEPWAGVVSLRQPTIRPIWQNRGFEDALLGIMRTAGADGLVVDDTAADPLDDGSLPSRDMNFHDFLQQVWREQVFEAGDFEGPFQDWWFAALRGGVLELETRPRFTRAAAQFSASRAAAALRGARPASAGGLTLAAFAMPNLYDGRVANNPWMLELPDPVSKICWDNFVAVAPSFASENGLRDGDIIRVQANGASVEAPVRRHPGAHPQVLSVGLGWGRTSAGAIGDGEGFNAFAIGSVDGTRLALSGGPVTWEKTGARTQLADVQGHNYMKANPANDWEADRAIVQVTNLGAINESDYAPQAVHPIPYWEHGDEKPSMYPKTDDPQLTPTRHKWVMAIDLNTCNGCNACMVACQAENNIPVVGKREVLVGREMHWIRIDRYFKGTPDDPEAAKMPMLCQHCANAPCETVCPVLATVHNDEGLNVQVYNRCAGTRYCANNCPYKVRRFNFFEYSKFRKGPHQNLPVKDTPLVLALNPEHTVRTKGIMEKCTFCHQRIREAKYDAKKKGRNIPDGELQTACQQTCPGKAIYFGDELNDAHEVTKIRKQNKAARGYGVLEEFGVKPSILYLAQVKNRPERPDDVRYQDTWQGQQGHGDGHGDEPHTSADNAREGAKA